MEQLTLLEKAALLSGGSVWESRGVDRLGIPQLFLADGPHGLRKQLGSSDHLGIAASEPATCFPTASAIANSWDPALAEEVGAGLGAEARAQGVHVLLGPGLNIKRSPLGGRNFEYYSEDPLLAGRMAAAAVRGIQSAGVAATPKHFAVNSQELIRMVSDSVVDERTLREIYLRGFEIVVREAAPWALMSGYNRINGIYANEHPLLLRQILREEWGFDGAVVTDWGGGNDPVAAIRAGSTLEMPSPGFDSARRIVAAVETGELDEADVDARVTELLELIERTTIDPQPVDLIAQHELARRAASQSIVLLRNEGDLLPLGDGHRVAIIGDFATTPRFQGAGSSQVEPTRLVSTLNAIEATTLTLTGSARGFRRDGVEDATLVAEAVEVARGAETVLLYLGLPELAESEGIDRQHLQLPQNQITLLSALAAATDRIVVVLSAGAALEMPWIGHSAAVLHGYLSGQGAAEAMLDVITGAVNPSGRLAETFPVRLADHPTAGLFPSVGPTAEYREGLYVGYRYFTSVNAPVAFPFGFGLSFTEFAYRALELAEGAAIVTIENVGSIAGSETVQLYVGRHTGPGAHRPKRQLRGFAKVTLAPGETGTVQIPLGDEAFRIWDAQENRWHVEAGVYPVEVGANVEDIRLIAQIEVDGGMPRVDVPGLTRYANAAVLGVPDEAFAALLGRPIPRSEWSDGPLQLNDPLSRMERSRSPLARFAFRMLDRRRHKAETAGEPDLNVLFLINMPFRAIAKMTNGAVSMAMAEAIVEVVNGRHVRGLGRLVGATVANLITNRSTRSQLADVSASDRRESRVL